VADSLHQSPARRHASGAALIGRLTPGDVIYHSKWGRGR
jgi:hypothetical protein